MTRLLGVVSMLAVVALAGLYGWTHRPGHGEVLRAGRRRDDVTDRAHPSHPSQSSVIRLAGVVRADAEVVVSPKVPARVRAVYVRNGDTVRPGDRLISLDMGDMQAQIEAAGAGVAAAAAVHRKAIRGKAARAAEMDGSVAQAEGGLEIARSKLKQAELGLPLAAGSAVADSDQAKAGIRQAEAGMRMAEAGLREAEDAVRRLEVLHKHGGIADVDLSGARTKAAMARAGYDAASAAHDLAVAAAKPAAEAVIPRRQVSEADVEAARSGVKLASDGLRLARSARSEALAIADHDIEAARAQTAQAQAGLRQARAAIGDATLTSPIHGIVTKLTADAGEYAQPGMALMRIVSPASRRHVEVAVPVRLVGALAVGMRAQVHPGPRTAPSASLEAAGDGMPMRAVVSEISPVAASDGRSVTVRLRLLDGDAAARPGAMVGVTVDTGRGRASGRR